MIVVDGFMRSGNTFLVSVLQCSFPDVEIKWGDEHPHRIETIRNPSGTLICPIREPLGCLTSYITLLRDSSHESIEKSCAEYSQWMEEVKNSSAIIAKFEDFTSRPSSIIDVVQQTVGVESRPIVPSILWKRLQENSTGIEAVLDPATGRLPREYPKERDFVLELLMERPSYLSIPKERYNAIINKVN